MNRIALFIFCATVWVAGSSTALTAQEASAPIGVDDQIFDDGPYVFWQDAKTAILISHKNGEIIRSVVNDISGPRNVPTPSVDVPMIHLDPNLPKPPASTWPMPKRLLAISDLEGNYRACLEFLKGNGVIDAEGRWAWGDGHLVFDGDIVDRGTQVTEILWLIHRLEREAEAAGGRVHYVLGNHEAMVMAGDLRYIHPKYQVISRRLGIPYEALFGPNTELGQWFRSRNTILRIGDYMFVHAGYSPALDALGLTPDVINEQIRATIGPPAWSGGTADLEQHLMWHLQGPMWYRGYFDQHAANWGGKPTDVQLDALLKRNAVKHIVVGHTVVNDIGWLDQKERLLGIDVKWSKPGEGEGLLVENGVPHAVDTQGKKRPIEVVQPAGRQIGQ